MIADECYLKDKASDSSIVMATPLRDTTSLAGGAVGSYGTFEDDISVCFLSSHSVLLLVVFCCADLVPSDQYQ